MATRTATKGRILSDVERAALQDTVRERKSKAKPGSAEERSEGEAAIHEKIAEMAPDDRELATRIHALVGEAAPVLVPKTFYGMPAYAKDGKVICFFQAKSKFKVRYSTFGFQPDARLDDGTMWPTSFAVIQLTPANEARLIELVRKAAGES